MTRRRQLPPWLPATPFAAIIASGSGHRRPSAGYAPDVEPLICSAKGCRANATWALAWNNPKLHEPDRRKTWLACDEHRESLSAFLDGRGFLRETTRLP